MGWYIVDTRDRTATAVTESADDPNDGRFVKTWADSVPEAFAVAFARVGHPLTRQAQRRADAVAAFFGKT